MPSNFCEVFMLKKLSEVRQAYHVPGLDEYGKVLYAYKANDPGHLIDRLKSRFFGLDLNDFNDVLKKGVTKIFDGYGHIIQQTKDAGKDVIHDFMVISKDKGMKIPVEVEFNKEKPDIIITTVLDKDEQPFNKHNPIPMLVEASKKGKYSQIREFEGFHSSGFLHIFQNGEHRKLFIEVEV